MFPLIKFLKIALPVATATAATIVTSSLVSFRKTDLDKTRDNEDQELNDFVSPDEKHEERKLFYSKEGDAKELTSISTEQAEQIEKILKEKNGDLGKGKQLGGGDVSEKINLQQNSEKVDGDTGQDLDTPQESVSPTSDQHPTKSHDENNLDNDVNLAEDIVNSDDGPLSDVKLLTSEFTPPEPQSKPSDVELTKDPQGDQDQQDDKSSLPSDDEKKKNSESRGEKNDSLEQIPQDKGNEGFDSKDNPKVVNSLEDNNETSKGLTNETSEDNDSNNELPDVSSSHKFGGEEGIHNLGENVKQYSDEEIRKLEDLKSELSKFSSELEGLIDLNN
ncbi:hypothetical protein A6V39_05790 [Candidatus Mycoplasma haematobovis]|uniref:Uncharacterized protein n=1 Tax=Candidatus Mycoplasma haematobovis TaxID=432608 RepID=A0A1A9QFR3_9MOLU|nr:hypothetical protein [Candidatus Mycoplasma haematobovis]OAL10786.1 hypothetical protein A6V39_05790 [Candidatus Mycoplasma haematobovis]